ncbi:MAG: hypothetical protein KF730_05280 [Sphingomonas sp.]|uniref:hypothetical protein n=1 Tax=Sphingomonas sp. TaxID=28214 RepID=UPI0025DFBF07|nr:hypothetical protein [Sphingomonas sp.]MBX3563974.1 hypothetical protein [Sphingomonas sp.]
MTRSTFALPAILAAATLFGLVVALTGDGLRDALACFALSLPVAAVAWAMRGKRT